MKTILKKKLIVILRVFLSLGLNFSSAPEARTTKKWRVYGQLLLREIGYQHNISPEQPATKAYSLYKNHLSSLPLHMERFQNFMAQTGIFRFLLAAEWLTTLGEPDQSNITSLLLQIRDKENVYVTYCHNPRLVRSANEIGKLDFEEDFFEPKIETTKPILAQTSPPQEPKVISSSDLDVQNDTANLVGPDREYNRILTSVGAVVGYIFILPITFLVASCVALLFFFIKPVRAWAARMKIGALVRYDRAPTELARQLSNYENTFTNNKADISRMRKLAARTNMFDKLVVSGWIDRISEAHRVMVSSLLRRIMNDSSTENNAAVSNIAKAIRVHQSSELPQLKLKNDYHRLDLKLFGPVRNTQGNVFGLEKAVDPKSLAPTKTTSEGRVQSENWFTDRKGPYFQVSEALRLRYYDKALKMCDDKALVPVLSSSESMNILALRNYLGKPLAKSSPLGRKYKDDVRFQPLFDRTIKQSEKKTIAAEILFVQPEVQESNSVRSLWLEAQEQMLAADSLAVSGTLENIAIEYSLMPQNRITQRTVSFDAFLITELSGILDNAKDWLDWHEEPASVLFAFAHCASLVGHRELTSTLFRIIDQHPRIKPPLKIALANSYLGRGFHTKSAISSSDNLEKLAEHAPLLAVEKEEKTLCLVEVSASIDGLLGLDGLSRNVVCAPVQPAEAAKFPSSVKKVQIEDHIPMYSVEDMDIGYEVDRLTDIAVKAVAKQFSDNNDTNEWADFVEVVHANVFFSIYRDMMAVSLIEKLVAKVKQYDKVVFVLKNGVALNVFFEEVIDAIGEDNVYFSLSNARKTEQNSCVQAVVHGKPTNELEVNNGKNNWRSGFATWMSAIETEHQVSQVGQTDTPYALHLLEHINGYYDSYVSLVKENLVYSDVELITGAGHKQLNDFIESPATERFQKSHALTRYIPRRQPPTSNKWMPQLAATMETCYDDISSPLFPKYKAMITWRAQNFMSYRLAQVLDLAAYFKARFNVQSPTHIFTGPNQHLASRTASILGKRIGIPTYDFLILTVTNHKRYRPPVSDTVYVYDEFYRDYYGKYFDVAADNIRISGPLFDYSKRFQKRPTTPDKAGKKRHVVFFSQSANYDVNEMILEDICKSLAGLKNVYLTIKLHPHESATNVGRYGDLAKQHGMVKNVSVWHKDADAIDLVNQADLVVQSFSNVGLDAFLLKKPVITVNFAEKSAASIFLFEKGVGKQVKTRAALRKATIDLLDNPKAKAAMARKAAKFAKDNKLYFEAENAKRVLKEVIADVNRNTL